MAVSLRKPEYQEKTINMSQVIEINPSKNVKIQAQFLIILHNNQIKIRLLLKIYSLYSLFKILIHVFMH
jgi:hypothetical protein